MNLHTNEPLVYASGNTLRFIENNVQIIKPALLIQPALGLLLFVGESEDAWKMKKMFEAVQDPIETPNKPLVVVPLGLNNPYGFSAEQSEYVINRMVRDVNNFVVQFYEHLCLDDDVRGWIGAEMRVAAAENSTAGAATAA